MVRWGRCLLVAGVGFDVVRSSSAFAPGRIDADTVSTAGTTRRRLAQSLACSSPGSAGPWIALVDDEPSIRLAVGDYLHSLGYTVTACDGPESFLRAMLWSVSWSIGGGDGDGGAEEAEVPPWIGRRRAGRRLWRVPNVIISDIRMPGAGGIDIDGVRLLELVRQSGGGGGEKGGGPYYSGPDDLELLDAIIRNTAAPQRRITTPSDMATEYLDKIQECVDRLGPSARADGPRHDCPGSLAEVPVILLTAKSMTADREKGLEAGANGYLPKPFRPEELVSLVEGELRRQRRRDGEGADGGGGGGAADPAATPGAEPSREAAADAERLFLGMAGARRSARVKADGAALRAVLPLAEAMLERGEGRKRLFTRDHIRALLLYRFGRYTSGRQGREKLMAILEDEMSAPADGEHADAIRCHVSDHGVKASQ